MDKGKFHFLNIPARGIFPILILILHAWHSHILAIRYNYEATITVEPLQYGNLGDLVKCPVQRGVLISGAIYMHIGDIAKCP